MPKLLKEFYDTLPTALTNNSREIVKSTWERIKHLNPRVIVNILEANYGIDLAYDDHYDIREPDYFNG